MVKLSALLLAGCIAWTPRDTVLEIGVGVTLAADATQTVVGQHRGYTERNPFLGSHPPDAVTVIWFLGCMGAHILIANALPEPYRAIWQAIVPIGEGYQVGENAARGLRL